MLISHIRFGIRRAEKMGGGEVDVNPVERDIFLFLLLRRLLELVLTDVRV